MCTCVLEYMYVHHLCATALGGKKTALEPLEPLEPRLQAVASHLMCVLGTEPRSYLCKNSKCAELLSFLSSSNMLMFCLRFL